MGHEVAKEIVKQLGGNRRLAMFLGVKRFLTSEDSVSFQFPNRARSKPNFLKVVLCPDDTYRMEFGRLGKYELTPLEDIAGVYCDQLVEIFENRTGLCLSL